MGVALDLSARAVNKVFEGSSVMPSICIFHRIRRVLKEKRYARPLQDSFSYIKNIITSVFPHEHQKKLFYERYAVLMAMISVLRSNMANQNVSSKRIRKLKYKIL
jgi:hypothetical protein